MAVPINRKMRRRAVKEKREPYDLCLIDWSGPHTTAGVYYDIMNTDWSGARNCHYDYFDGMGWSALLGSTKFYFAPAADRFRCRVSTCWSSKTSILFTVQGNGLLVNIAYHREDTQTVTLFFPNSIMDMTDPVSMVQKKSSTFYQNAIQSHRITRMEYSTEQRAELKETYIANGVTEEWANIMCGMTPDEELDLRLCSLIISDVLVELLQVFRTLAFIDYSKERGRKVLVGDNELTLSPQSIADIEAVCTNCSSPVSRIPIVYESAGSVSKHVTGDSKNFYNVYTNPIPKRAIEWLREWSAEEEIDLDAVTECSRNAYFFLDKSGNPIEVVGFSERKDSGWMLTATGLTYSLSGHAIFGLYRREDNHWCWEYFVTLLELYKRFEDEKLSGLSISKWQPLLNSKFVLKGVGLRDSLEDERDLPDEVCYYKCSPDVLEVLEPNSNIKTLDQMNYFLDGFIRMLRRRRIAESVDACYNTGLVNKEGGFIYLLIPNLAGKKDAIQPDLVRVKYFDSNRSRPILPYREISQLIIKRPEDITLDEKSLMHVISERDYRIPTELSGFSKPELMEWVKESLRHSQMMLLSNPFFAQPCYSVSMDDICYLLPLYSEHKYDKEHLSGALFIRNRRVATLYSVDMARDHACLFNTPKAVWFPD